MTTLHILTATILLAVAPACSDRPPVRETPPTLIAHAGGIGNHRVYTNSLEALDHSVAAGHTLIEIDLSWTSDDHLVLVHDWDREFVRIFDREPGQLSRTDFLAAESPWGITQLSLDDLEPFLRGNPGVALVTDIKERNLEGLTRIVDRYPKLRHRFVPQIYHPEEMDRVEALGFERIIFTLYMTELPDSEIVSFAESAGLWAVTMPPGRARSGDLAARLASSGTPVYVHTINDRLTMEALRRVGVFGIYTDWLAPSDAQKEPDTSAWLEQTDGLRALDHRAVAFVPWAMDGLQQFLDINNPESNETSTALSAIDSSGQLVAVEEIVVAAGENRVFDLTAFATGGSGQGWLRIDGGENAVIEMRRRFREGAEQKISINRHSYGRLLTRGSGLGVSGLLLAVVNPTQSTQTYVLRRRIGNELIDDETAEVEPEHQLLRVYRSSTDHEIELTVTGGPMVAHTLKWDAMLDTVW